MKNNKKLKVIIAIIIILIIIIGVVIGIVSNNSSIYIKDSNYKIAKISKQNDVYQYTNNWKMDTVDYNGTLNIKYNAKSHTIDREIQINSEQYNYKDILSDNTSINGDLILNENKDGILTYSNGFIPYINSKNNTFGIINPSAGYKLELGEGKTVLDVIPTNIQPGLEVFLRDTNENEKKQLEEQIKKISCVKEVTFKSKEDAFNIMKEKFKDNPSVLNGAEDILPESFVIKVEKDEDVDLVVNKIKNNSNIKKINEGKVSEMYKSPLAKIYKELCMFSMIIKDNENNRVYFAANNITQTSSKNKTEISYSNTTYLDIYVARNNKKELQGFIAEKENNKKVFLNINQESVTKEYKFMNFVEVNSENYIVCSNSNIKTDEDIKNANFEVFDVDGNPKTIDKSDFIELLKLKQTNYSDKNSLEYKLFE